MKYNTAGQYLDVVVVDSNGLVTGQAANLTCKLDIDDSGTFSSLTTNTATEVEPYLYRFPLSQAETNGYKLSFVAICSISGKQAVVQPSNTIYTSLEHLIYASLSSGGSSAMAGAFEPSLVYNYTSLGEMQRQFSRDGVDFRVDDYNETSESDLYDDVIEEIIEQASWEVKAIINKKFVDADASPNIWIRRRATIIACHLLSIRRGNDAQYFNEFLDAMADLEDAVSGRVQLGIASGQFVRPGMTNVSSDNRYPFTPMRVDFFTSTDLQGAKYWNYYRPYVWI